MKQGRAHYIFEDRQTQLQLNEQEKQDILLLRSIIGENNVVLQIDGKVLIRHYVGFVQIGNTRLLIYPKIASRGHGKELYQRAFLVLLNMLVVTGFSQVKGLKNPQAMDVSKGDLVEVFLAIFADALHTLLKRDIHRHYRETGENMSFIKGKIDFAENTRQNSHRKHLHAVRYDEFSEDIQLNRIFKTVCRILAQKTKVQSTRKVLGQCLLWFEDVEELVLSREIWDSVTFTRFNRPYETVFNMAKLLFSNLSPNMNRGVEQTLSFLVPVNQLFEAYVYKIIQQSAKPYQTVRYQAPQKYLAQSNGKGAFLLKPDISVMEGDEVQHIFDAKYKEVLLEDGTVCPSQADIYQMLAYSVRFNCRRVTLVYPKMLDATYEGFLVGRSYIPKEGGDLCVDYAQVDLEDSIESAKGKILSTYE